MASSGRQKIANGDDPWKVSAVVSAIMELLLSVLLLLGAGIAFITSLLVNYFDLEPPCSSVGCSHVLLIESRNKHHTSRGTEETFHELCPECRPSRGYAKRHKFSHTEGDRENSFLPKGDDFSSSISSISTSDVDAAHHAEDTYVSSEVQFIQKRSSVSNIRHYKKSIKLKHVKRRAFDSEDSTLGFINEDCVPLFSGRDLSACASKSNDGDYCEMLAKPRGKLRMPNTRQGKSLQREPSTADVASPHRSSDDQGYMLLNDDDGEVYLDTFFDSYETTSGCENVHGYSTLAVDDDNFFEAGQVHSGSAQCDIKVILEEENGPLFLAEASNVCEIAEECEDSVSSRDSCEGEHHYVVLEGADEDKSEGPFAKEMHLESAQPLLNSVSDEESEVPNFLNIASSKGLLVDRHRPEKFEQLAEDSSYHKLAEVGIQTVVFENQQHGYILLRNDDEDSFEASDSENMLSDCEKPMLQVQEGEAEASRCDLNFAYAKLAAKGGASHCGDPKQLAEDNVQCESPENNRVCTNSKGFESLDEMLLTEALLQGFSSDRGSGCLGRNLAMAEGLFTRDNCLKTVPLADLEIVWGLRNGQKTNVEEPLLGDLLGADSLEEIKSSVCGSQLAVTGDDLLSGIFGMDLKNQGSCINDKVQPGFQQGVDQSELYGKDLLSNVCSSNPTMLQDVFLFHNQGQVDKLEVSSSICFAKVGGKRQSVAADGFPIQDDNTTEKGYTGTPKNTLEGLLEMVIENSVCKPLLGFESCEIQDKSMDGAANVKIDESALDVVAKMARQDKEDIQVGKAKEEGLDVLREALCAERNTLAALETELENERNAAAIATSEAMAMISRLQEEKSAMQLEVAQLQRMAEEKAEYDEHAMALLKEILFKREAEKHALEKEVEVYRERLSAEKVEETENKGSSTCSSTSLSLLNRIDEDQGPFSSERHNSRPKNVPSLDEFYKAENTSVPCLSNTIYETRTEPSAQFAKSTEARSLKGLHLNGQVDIGMADNRRPLIEGLGTSRSIFSSNDEETQFILERLWVLEEELRELRGVDGLGAQKNSHEVQCLDCRSAVDSISSCHGMSSSLCHGREAGGHAIACLPIHDVFEVHSASSRQDQCNTGGCSKEDIVVLEDVKSSHHFIMHEEELAGTMCCGKSHVITHTGRVSSLNESQCHVVPYAGNAHAPLSKTTEGKPTSTDVIQQLAVRLQVLETDRELLREVLESFRHKDAELKLLQEIAQQLRQFQMVGFSSISTGAAALQDLVPATFGKSCTRALKKRRYCSEVGQAEVYNVLVQKEQAKPICLVGLKPEDMDMDDWIELEELANSTIMLTLHKSVCFNVKDTKGAYGVWQALSNLYKKKVVANQVFWLKKLVDLHKKETTPMSTHLNEFRTILSQLQAHEVEFQDSVKAMFLLVTFPDSWDTFCIAINNLEPENGLKCADVESSLLMEELNCKNVDASRSYNAMHVRGRQQSRGNYGSSDRKKSKSKERSKFRSGMDVECHHCHKKSHVKKDCYKWKNKQEKKNRDDKGKEKFSDSVNNVKIEELNALTSNSDGDVV
ncbi:hypothetical protein L7F22_007330 [Adiantum nelumboides]|nr:hypothetical protein [Adiantum nelumboides]